MYLLRSFKSKISGLSFIEDIKLKDIIFCMLHGQIDTFFKQK